MVVLLLGPCFLAAARLPCLCGSPRPLPLLMLTLLVLSLLWNYYHATPLPTGELSKSAPWSLLIPPHGAPRA